MMQLVPLLLFAQAATQGVPSRVDLRDPLRGPTPAMSGWVILPPKVRDCRNDQEDQLALEQERNGDQALCEPSRQARLAHR